MISNYVNLSVMWDPNRLRWEAWDTGVRPRVLGLGSTPQEAVFELTENLHRLGNDAPGWVRQQEDKH